MFTQSSFRISCILAMLLLSTSANAGQNWEYLVKTYPLLGNDGALTQTLNKLGELVLPRSGGHLVKSG